MFPLVDPIPLPAPVWLMKFLGLLTLALHFLAVQLLVGGLATATLWSLLGRSRRDPVLLDASGAVANRLPIVMTYVINLGVPPLLFTQVLYGRPIYSSSVLIGLVWIAIIGILMFAYALLYAINKRAAAGKAWSWIGLISLLLILKIGYIYSTNMTLMLRPDLWREMYRGDSLGAQFSSGDPTVLPRWTFMMVGSFAVAGVGMMLLGMKTFLSDEAARFLRYWGGVIAIGGAVAQLALSVWVMQTQPAEVLERMGTMAGAGIYGGAQYAFLLTTLLVAVAGGLGVATASRRNWLAPAVGGLAALLSTCSMVLVRDGIRDASLLLHNYDVWDRAVHSNWIVVGAFLLLFVAGLGVVAWLGSVVARAEGVQESYV